MESRGPSAGSAGRAGNDRAASEEALDSDRASSDPRRGESAGADLADPPAPLARREGTGRSLTPAEVERVIRRASDLQFQAGSSDVEGLAEGELLRIGEEVGLSPRYVRQALAEVRADSLVPSLPEESATAIRLFGSSMVRASRVVRGDRPEVEASLSVHLRERELLKQVRSQEGCSLWEPAGGLLSTMRRAMDVGGRGYELAKARSVAVDIEPLETGWSLVTLTADLRNVRNEAATGWYLGGVAVAASAWVMLLLTGGAALPVVLGSGLASGAALATATWATGAHLRRRRTRMELALQGILDRLERGEDLAEEAGSWTAGLKEGLKEGWTPGKWWPS